MLFLISDGASCCFFRNSFSVLLSPSNQNSSSFSVFSFSSSLCSSLRPEKTADAFSIKSFFHFDASSFKVSLSLRASSTTLVLNPSLRTLFYPTRKAVFLS